MRACIGLGVLPVTQHQYAHDRLVFGASLKALVVLVAVPTPSGSIFAAVPGGAALLGFGLPAGLPLLDEGVRHLQGVPEARVTAVGQNVYLEVVRGNE